MNMDKFRESWSKSTETTITSSTPVSSGTTMVSKDIDPSNVLKVTDFFNAFTFPEDSSIEEFSSLDSFSVLFQQNMKAISVARGRISCSLIVTPPICNYFKGLHGGSVASIAERVSMACAKTVVSEDKQLFLGELSMSYLSAAPLESELIVEGSVVKTGRNLTMVTVEFKLKETMKVTYLSRATIYHTLASKL